MSASHDALRGMLTFCNFWEAHTNPSEKDADDALRAYLDFVSRHHRVPTEEEWRDWYIAGRWSGEEY